ILLLVVPGLNLILGLTISISSSLEISPEE
ncbi:unnamed protein product, partial [marine sediment metagenome]